MLLKGEEQVEDPSCWEDKLEEMLKARLLEEGPRDMVVEDVLGDMLAMQEEDVLRLRIIMVEAEERQLEDVPAKVVMQLLGDQLASWLTSPFLKGLCINFVLDGLLQLWQPHGAAWRPELLAFGQQGVRTSCWVALKSLFAVPACGLFCTSGPCLPSGMGEGCRNVQGKIRSPFLNWPACWEVVFGGSWPAWEPAAAFLVASWPLGCP